MTQPSILLDRLDAATAVMSSPRSMRETGAFAAAQENGLPVIAEIVRRFRKGVGSGHSIWAYFLILNDAYGNQTKPENMGKTKAMVEEWLAWIDGHFEHALVKPIIFFEPVIHTCDLKCEKAWGICGRPRIMHDEDDEDDYSYLADHEVGEAPENPGTYEGGHGKPFRPREPNKWCVRECERSEMLKHGDDMAVKIFDHRVPNFYRRRDYLTMIPNGEKLP